MNKIKYGIIGIVTLLLASTSHTFAVVGQALQVQGTNFVLSWPSQGYEIYYVQSRSTLNSTDSWSSLTNDYPAGINQTTLPLPRGTNSTGFFQVYHIPNFLADFSGYTFDGPTFIPVDYADYVDRVDDTTVLLNGQPTDDAVFTSDVIGGQTYWGVGIYFDRLPNGTNTIQLVSTLRLSDTLDDNTVYLVLSNAVQGINIGNFVTYTNWDDLIWNNTNYTFRAQSSATNVDWEIDIYDVYGDFVNSQTGHSDDGNISWTWDLTDYNGDSRSDPDADPDFYPYITITDDSGDPSGYMPSVAAQFPSMGGWLVAYMDNFYSDGRTNYDASSDNSYYSGGINAIVGAAAEWSLPVQKFPIAYGSSYAQTNRDTSWSNLASWLYYPQYRNFYYFGHGSADVIGSDVNSVDSSNNITGGDFLPNTKAYLKSKTISDNVAFNPSGARPYRFVFLDGCNTANGNFAPAFGIPKQAIDASWYFTDQNTRHIRPSAFMGWNTEVGAGPNVGWGTVQGFWNFRKEWIADWLNINEDEELDQAIIYAEQNSNWAASDKINEALVYYGDKELEYLQYNYGGDWPQ